MLVEVRDGTRYPWKFKNLMPKYRIPQRYPKNAQEKKMMIAKVWSPIMKDYISSGYVICLSGFFCVPKGLSDVRIVNDMTKCDLNTALWSPRFFLPTPDSIFDAIEYNAWMADTDQGEMFLNYFVDPELLPYLGVDMTDIARGSEFDNQKEKVWFRWNRWHHGGSSVPIHHLQDVCNRPRVDQRKLERRKQYMGLGSYQVKSAIFRQLRPL